MPQAIVIAGVLIAGALLISSIARQRMLMQPGLPSSEQVAESGTEDQNQLALTLPVEEGVDHVRGNPEGRITIYEYSDIDCPFCQRFHTTLQTIVEENEEVRWVYRHLPLEALHPEAFQKSVITECVAQLAGQDAFWEVIDGMYENPTTLSDLPNYVAIYNLDSDEYATCLSSEEAAQRVERDMANAFATRGSVQVGTPWSIIELPDGSRIPFSGAQPTSVLQGVVDAILAQAR